jgi:hypothetical protein
LVATDDIYVKQWIVDVDPVGDVITIQVLIFLSQDNSDKIGTWGKHLVQHLL